MSARRVDVDAYRRGHCGEAFAALPLRLRVAVLRELSAPPLPRGRGSTAEMRAYLRYRLGERAYDLACDLAADRTAGERFGLTAAEWAEIGGDDLTAAEAAEVDLLVCGLSRDPAGGVTATLRRPMSHCLAGAQPRS